VAIGASAGGLHALMSVVGSLPADFPAAVVIVQHLDPKHRSMLADILGRHTPLRVKEAEDGETIASGVIYTAPPDRRLLVNGDGTLSRSELVHFLRPSADLLPESVAASFKGRAIAVILSGTGSDGGMGVKAIKKMGGAVIAQDPRTAEFSGMPGAAILTECVDSVRMLHEIGPNLVARVTREKPHGQG
jgi:two-component system chemotaxis response regulator CheB